MGHRLEHRCSKRPSRGGRFPEELARSPGGARLSRNKGEFHTQTDGAVYSSSSIAGPRAAYQIPSALPLECCGRPGEGGSPSR